MKFALVNGNKTEARPGLQGTCVNCQSDMIAKCGQVRIWHWAHKSKFSCDPWWENETEWHRAWKNHFPTEWQESVHIDSTTGEKHIADIKTDKEFVIEFQYSAIRPNEIQSRESFYKSMVWVIDGTRLKRDHPRFCKGFSDLRPLIKPYFFLSYFPEKCFPQSWLTSSVPVYFDFKGDTPFDQQDRMRAHLWCLFPRRMDRGVVVAWISRKKFIECSSTNPDLLFAQDALSHIEQLIQPEQAGRDRKFALETKRVYGKYPRIPRRRRRL